MEVVIGVALMIIAFAGMSQVSLQLVHLHERYAAQSRLETTVADMLADARAILRYDSPAAQALQAGLVPATFTVYQWEPDMPQAPVQCTAQHLAQPVNVLHLVCNDRSGTTAAGDISLDISQPLPNSVVTASPSPQQ